MVKQNQLQLKLRLIKSHHGKQHLTIYLSYLLFPVRVTVHCVLHCLFGKLTLDGKVLGNNCACQQMILKGKEL